MVTTEGLSLHEASRRLSLPESTLGNWIKLHNAGKLGNVGKAYRPLTELEMELARTKKELATCQFIERNEWAIFVGPVGVGKSHTVQALGHQACRLGHKVFYTKTSRLLSDLGGGHADGSWESRLRRYMQPDLLILDDFAMKEFTVQQSEGIYELVGNATGQAHW